MVKKRVTSQQVADRAGVSRTTVSLVLNNVTTANISEETRQLVLRTTRELNYVPDVAARSLASGRSNNIGLILIQPHHRIFIDAYIPSIIAGLSQVTQQHGFRILIEIIKDVTQPNTYMNLMWGNEIAGMILSNPKADDAEITALAASDFPIVSLDYLNELVYSVSTDDLGGVQKAVTHLAHLGHRRIACIPYAPIDANNQVADRLQVYYDTLESFNITPDDTLIRYGNRDPESGYAAMQSLLELDPLPTALFAMNDIMALGAMAAIREHGLRIPDDIAVVGYDDILPAQYSTPTLTTINKNDIEHGVLAGQMLVDLIHGRPVDKPQISLEPALVIRNSCSGRQTNTLPLHKQNPCTD
ncbi:MAG: LacI family DNA-binding transcriptional regulator [Anaerolineae bacterium]|nr:LacI family DNA-binding transcriptional regulator [Anaerolineae bacterium]